MKTQGNQTVSSLVLTLTMSVSRPRRWWWMTPIKGTSFYYNISENLLINVWFCCRDIFCKVCVTHQWNGPQCSAGEGSNLLLDNFAKFQLTITTFSWETSNFTWDIKEKRIEYKQTLDWIFFTLTIRFGL